jgi:hypothetical protein
VVAFVHCLATASAVASPASIAGESGCSLLLCIPSALSEPPSTLSGGRMPAAATAGIDPKRSFPRRAG